MISAPAGGGKYTLLQRLRSRGWRFFETVSATTRPPRKAEQHGVHYFFLERGDFEAKRDAGAFLEWAEVHGNLYGTLREELDRYAHEAVPVVMELDVQGMRNVRSLFPEAVTIFLMPPSVAELERRLRQRGTESEASIQLRLSNANAEIGAAEEYDCVIMNDCIDDAVEHVERVLRSRGFEPVNANA